MRTLDALGGMLAAPVTTLRRLAREGAALWAPGALLVLVALLVDAKVVLRLLWLLDEGGLSIARRLRDELVRDIRTDAVVVAATAAVAALLARLWGKDHVSPGRAVAAVVWLLVPLAALRCVGGAAEAVGLGRWWLPDDAVDSMAAVVAGRVDLGRLAVRALLSYGPPLGLLVAAIVSLTTSAAEPAPPSPRRLRIGLIALGLVVSVFAALAFVSAARVADRIRPLQVGDTLPDVTLRVIDETGVQRQKIAVASARGQVLVLDFWASWCAPCRRSLPELSALARELQGKGLSVIAVNRDLGEPAKAAAALGELRLSFPSVFDDRHYGDRIGVTSLPTSYVVDREGVVRHMHLGYAEPAALRAEVGALLAEGAGSR